MTYTAILHAAEEGGYWATCLEVSGVSSQGETREECLHELAEAVRFMVDAEREEQLAADIDAELVPITVP